MGTPSHGIKLSHIKSSFLGQFQSHRLYLECLHRLSLSIPHPQEFTVTNQRPHATAITGRDAPKAKLLRMTPPPWPLTCNKK